MFRKKKFTRSRGRLETRAHASRAFKRVTRQWQMSLNIKCQMVEATPGDVCPNGGKIQLLSQAELQGSAAFPSNANFPDALRIKRIEGNLYFRPTLDIPATSGDPILDCVINAFENFRTTYMRMGLRKAQGPQSQSGVPDALNPLNNGANPHEISDYADGRWMKLWEHIWDARPELGQTAANQFNCCSTQAGFTLPGWATTLGTGTWAGATVPPVVCVPCGDVEEPAVNLGCTYVTHVPTWWHVPIRYGRTIVLKENDDLGLYFGWEKLLEVPETTRHAQPAMQFFGGIRLLLES